MEIVSEKYNYKTLTLLIGEKVRVIDSQEHSVFLTISEVIKNKLDGNEWEAFSVVYTGENNFRIAQGTYTFQHDSFGEKNLFLSPNSETEYETVITRKRNVAEEENADCV